MKFCLKSFVSGAIVATVGIATVFAAGGIKSAEFNTNKVVVDGKEINMSANPMISVVKEGETSFSNYMPLRAVLEAMGYEVSWDGASKTVNINSAKSATGSSNAQNTDVAKKLLGYWTNTQDDTTTKYHFHEDGTFEALGDIKNIARDVFIGGYTVSGNTVTLKFMEDLGKPSAVFTVEFAADGKSWWDTESKTVFTVDTGSTSWTDEEGPEIDIVGYWTCTSDDVTIKYHFDGDGKYQTLAEIKDVGSEVFSGTYTIHGSAVTLKQDDGKTAGFFTVEFAPDGKSWSSIVSLDDDDEVIVFTVDNGSTDWTKKK